METILQRKYRHFKHRLIYKLGGTPNEKIPINRFHYMSNMLEGLRKRGNEIRTVIDIGASDGQWTRLCLKEFPLSTYLLLEPNAHHFPYLEKFLKEHSNLIHSPCVAGRSTGLLSFDSSNPYSGLASEQESESMLPATSIDHEIASRKLSGPYLIKLDTHGFELPILEGAKDALRETSALIIECYPRSLGGVGIPFWNMAHWLEQRGFHCIDLADPIYRKKDGTLWQLDLLFVRNDRPECLDTNYL